MSGVVDKDRNSPQLCLGSLYNTLWSVRRCQIDHHMLTTHAQRPYQLLQRIWFLFLCAPGHETIIVTPMGEKDINGCPGQRQANGCSNAPAATRPRHNRQPPGIILSCHILILFSYKFDVSMFGKPYENLTLCNGVTTLMTCQTVIHTSN